MSEPPANYSVVAFDVPGFDWGAIERSCKTPFNRLQRERLANAVACYLVDLAFETETPPTKAVRRRLESIAKTAQKLANALGTSTTTDEAVFNRLWPWRYNIDPSTFRAVLRDIALAGQRQDGISGRAGRRPGASLRRFVLEARDIWRDAGNSGRGSHWNEAWDRYDGGLLNLIEALLFQVENVNPPARRTVHEHLASD